MSPAFKIRPKKPPRWRGYSQVFSVLLANQGICVPAMTANLMKYKAIRHLWAFSSARHSPTAPQPQHVLVVSNGLPPSLRSTCKGRSEDNIPSLALRYSTACMVRMGHNRTSGLQNSQFGRFRLQDWTVRICIFPNILPNKATPTLQHQLLISAR